MKFLTFREAQERLNKHLLAGQPLRDPETGGDNGVRLLDVDGDGYLDVVIGNAAARQMPASGSRRAKSWAETTFPCRCDTTAPASASLDGRAVGSPMRPDGPRGWQFDGLEVGRRRDRSIAGLPKPARAACPAAATWTATAGAS